ncbi:type II secretion system GspH family protein [Patescibacteria group bacterium]|nr:type II secretion system GspH family protein [Patescibacteria group bacterium]MBU1472905.1 type II secretion system GspH family protein [Patescibacteria group bacterium]
MRNIDERKGFSLIELLVVIAIIAVLLGLALPNFLGARQRAQDAKRKEEVNQLKQALRMYYNDYQRYPPSATCGGRYNQVSGCGVIVPPATYPAACCPMAGCNVDFAAGGSGCDVIYMKKFPSQLSLGNNSSSYAPFPAPPAANSGDDFCLKVTLDNKSDADITTSQARCVGVCASMGPTEYVVCAD